MTPSGSLTAATRMWFRPVAMCGLDRPVARHLRHPRRARPVKIGKTASNGCVRLTNWDAEQLAAGVKPGVVVRFI
jgi:hypothetical protein